MSGKLPAGRSACGRGAGSAARRRILIYGDSNTFGFKLTETGEAGRISPELTWPGVIAARLSESAAVIAEGLPGRTTDLQRPLGAGTGEVEGCSMNGADYLPASLSSHLPLDLVVIMLGTNDMYDELNRGPEDIALALGRLTRLVRDARWQSKTRCPVPEVLIVCPPKLKISDGRFYPFFNLAGPKSERLAAVTAPVVRACGAHFFDAAQVVPYAMQPDHLHLTEDQHRLLGEAVAVEIGKILRL